MVKNKEKERKQRKRRKQIFFGKKID